METEIYVGNLAESVTEQDLQDLFSQVGDVVAEKIIRDRISGQPRGFGFVTMGSAEEADEAISRLNGQELQGRSLKIALARGRSQQRRPPDRDRPPRPGGSSGGFRRRGPRY
jgi:RNA recognition motif-containing protein